MMRTISRAAASIAFLTVMATFCAADEYAPPTAPAPAPEPAPKSSGGPAFSDMQLQPGAGQAANGIQLAVSAEQAVLPETPRAIGQPLIVQPTALHLFFKNVSGQPIVLDAYNLALSRMSMIVVGPEKESVVVTRSPATVKTREPLPIDYPQIEPGNTFIPMWGVAPLQFPGDFNALASFALYKPGEYKVQVIYSSGTSVAHGAWQGTVVSNTLRIRVVGPMPPAPPEKAPPPPEGAPAPEPAPPLPSPPTTPPKGSPT